MASSSLVDDFFRRITDSRREYERRDPGPPKKLSYSPLSITSESATVSLCLPFGVACLTGKWRDLVHHSTM